MITGMFTILPMSAVNPFYPSLIFADEVLTSFRTYIIIIIIIFNNGLDWVRPKAMA